MKEKNAKKNTTKETNNKINTIFMKEKGRIFTKQKLAVFKEPVALLMRKTGMVEFYENVKGDELAFEDANGHDLAIALSPEFLQTFEYAGTTFKGYICYEEEAFPLPQKPIVYAELMQSLLYKTLHDIRDWRAKVLDARAGLIWKILLGVAIIIGAIGMYKLLVGNPAPVVIAQNLPLTP